MDGEQRSVWLAIYTYSGKVSIYREGGSVEDTILAGEDVMPGFTFDLSMLVRKK